MEYTQLKVLLKISGNFDSGTGLRTLYRCSAVNLRARGEYLASFWKFYFQGLLVLRITVNSKGFAI